MIATDDFPPLDGGVSTWTSAVAGGLRDAGHDVVVYARRRSGLGEGTGLDVRGVPGPSFGRWGSRWMGLALWRALKPGDVLLASTWNMATHALRSAARADVPVHTVFHGSDLTVPTDAAADFQAVLDGASHRWAVSRYLAELVEGRGAAAEVLPSPIDPAEPRSPSTAPEHWGLVARATPLKGGERFIRLVAQADARGTVVGDGPALHRWKALAAQLGADITFTGRLARAQVLDVVRTLDLMVLLPTTHRLGTGAEGLGLVLLEAASVGVPAVGCATGGVPEAVGPAGLVLAHPEDAAGSVAAIREWWTPDSGMRAREWLGDVHGVRRCVARLLPGMAP